MAMAGIVTEGPDIAMTPNSGEGPTWVEATNFCGRWGSHIPLRIVTMVVS